MNQPIFQARAALLIISLLLLLPIADAAAEAFRVGVSVPLSGPFAEYGSAVQNGIELARRRHPEKFSAIEFFYEDDAYQPVKSITAFNKLVNRDRVQLYFVWGNEPALAVVPLAERRRIPVIAMAQDVRTAIGYQYAIRFINPTEEYSRKLVEHLRGRNLKTFAVIASELSFFNALLDGLQKNLRRDEKMIVIDTFLPDDMDFKTTMAKLKRTSFDALGVYLTPPQVVRFYRQAAEQNLQVSTFGTTPFESRTVISQALGHMNGAVYAHNYVEEGFRDDYLALHGDDNQIAYAANAHEFAMLTAQLFGNSSSNLTSDEILAAYKTTSPRQGVGGPYRFRKTAAGDKYFEFNIVIKKIVGSKAIALAN